MKTFDLIVLGGGSGGIATANRAASYGANVALIEKDALGGTCVNRGCVPKKVMWYAAAIKEMMGDASGYGLTAESVHFSWETLKKSRDRYIERLNGLYTKGLANNRITSIQGTGRFVDAQSIEVNGQTYRAKHILIATGGAPVFPDIEGAALGGSSDDFFEMDALPAKVAIVGAGYIAVELACVLQALGSEVHLLLRHGSVLRDFDELLGSQLLAEMQNQGMHIHTHTHTRSLSKHGGTLTLNANNHLVLDKLDRVFWAIGRRPYLDTLGIDSIGLALEPSGHVRIDEWQQSNIKGVYAVGDITPQAPLTPVAIAAGRRLADRLFGDQPEARLQQATLPTAVFSHPPIATVGLTEAQAIAHYGQDNIRVYSSSFTSMYYALTAHKIPSHIKMIAALNENEKVVGFHMIGKDADEIIQGVAIAMQAGATYSHLKDTIAVHPTSAEEIVLLK